MADNSDSMLKVVELFVDNINESTKTVTKDLDKINDSIDDLSEKMSTPPRHQELEKDHKDLDKKITLILESLSSIEDAVKNGIRTIKIAAGVFSIAIFIAVSVITYFNTAKPAENKIQIEQIMENQTEILQKLGKEK